MSHRLLRMRLSGFQLKSTRRFCAGTSPRVTPTSARSASAAAQTISWASVSSSVACAGEATSWRIRAMRRQPCCKCWADWQRRLELCQHRSRRTAPEDRRLESLSGRVAQTDGFTALHMLDAFDVLPRAGLVTPFEATKRRTSDSFHAFRVHDVHSALVE